MSCIQFCLHKQLRYSKSFVVNGQCHLSWVYRSWRSHSFDFRKEKERKRKQCAKIVVTLSHKAVYDFKFIIKWSFVMQLTMNQIDWMSSICFNPTFSVNDNTDVVCALQWLIIGQAFRLNNLKMWNTLLQLAVVLLYKFEH